MAPDCHVTAWDISPMALEVARNNAHRLGATIDCHLCDVLTPPDDYDIWDVIVSNPPYICQQEAATMSPNVLGHEPHTALFVPDDNPLLFYQAIASYACRALRPGGLLYVELNPLYADRVEELFTLHGLCCVQLRCDQFGKVRFAKATKQLQQ
jgi:release factor glutamine methyltransferase